MPTTFNPRKHNRILRYERFFQPLMRAMQNMPELASKGNRPLQMTFEDHLKALVFFHLHEHTSAQHLLQVLEQDNFAKNIIAPKKGIKKSSFSEANNSRGVKQLLHVLSDLQAQASSILPKQHPELGCLVGIDGSLIDATLSMTWADYRKDANKAKVHVGFDLIQSIPRKVFLTDGKAPERTFVDQIIEKDQTGVMDRGYQSHKMFDRLQADGKYFVCRIVKGTHKTILETHAVQPDSIVFFDGIVLLGSQQRTYTKTPVRLVGYEVDCVKYWIATNRFDLTAEQIAQVYKLRWGIETFFAWWKRHLKVYHLISRSPYGLMVQILAGLITYVLLAIYCHEQFNEKVSINRVRQFRIQMENDLRSGAFGNPDFLNEQNSLESSDAKT